MTPLSLRRISLKLPWVPIKMLHFPNPLVLVPFTHVWLFSPLTRNRATDCYET